MTPPVEIISKCLRCARSTGMRWAVYAKLRWLGVQHWIVDDWDSKTSELGRQFYDDSDFNVKIGFRLNDDAKIHPFAMLFSIFLIHFLCFFNTKCLFFDIFWLKDQKCNSKCHLNHQKLKMSKSIKKVNRFMLFGSFSIFFDIFWISFNQFQNFWWNTELIQFILSQQIWIQKSWLNTNLNLIPAEI